VRTSHHPPDRGDDDVGAAAQARLLRGDRRPAEDGNDLDVQVLGVGTQRLGHLDAELAGRRHHDRLGRFVARVEVLEQRQPEGGGLAGPGLGLADHIVAGEQRGDCLLLNRGRLGVAELFERGQDLGLQAELFEVHHRAKGTHTG
jgi:hypothetical protein